MPDLRAHAPFLPPHLPPTRAATPGTHSPPPGLHSFMPTAPAPRAVLGGKTLSGRRGYFTSRSRIGKGDGERTPRPGRLSARVCEGTRATAGASSAPPSGHAGAPRPPAPPRP